MEHIALTASRPDKLSQKIQFPAARIPLWWILWNVLLRFKTGKPILILRHELL